MYPSWIHEQHWNDGIILYNDTYNGGYKFSSYQWYQNGEPLVGETKEYLYLPGGLLLNNRGDCDNYYQVQLTREKDGYSTLTCPICPIYLTNDTIVPRLDYFFHSSYSSSKRESCSTYIIYYARNVYRV